MPGLTVNKTIKTVEAGLFQTKTITIPNLGTLHYASDVQNIIKINIPTITLSSPQSTMIVSFQGELKDYKI